MMQRVTMEESRSVGRASRIVNGENAAPNQFPYQARMLAPVSGGYVVCGGSILSDIWVCTAAHCMWNLDQRTWTVGILNWNEQGRQILSTSGVIHHGYNGQSLDNDIAVSRLVSSIGAWAPNIAPVTLPTLSEENEAFVGAHLIPSGFGTTGSTGQGGLADHLQWTDMSGISNQECSSVYGNIGPFIICTRGRNRPESSTCGVSSSF